MSEKSPALTQERKEGVQRGGGTGPRTYGEERWRIQVRTGKPFMGKVGRETYGSRILSCVRGVYLTLCVWFLSHWDYEGFFFPDSIFDQIDLPQDDGGKK